VAPALLGVGHWRGAATSVLITNGQQTLGVALPWGIAACLVRPGDKVLRIYGAPSEIQS
jgi:thiamine pyrophosphate-dependent acetolactate synthase large subunit-like protein